MKTNSKKISKKQERIDAQKFVDSLTAREKQYTVINLVEYPMSNSKFEIVYVKKSWWLKRIVHWLYENI